MNEKMLKAVNEAAKEIGATADIDPDGALRVLFPGGGYYYGGETGGPATNRQAGKAIHDIREVKQLLDEDDKKAGK